MRYLILALALGACAPPTLPPTPLETARKAYETCLATVGDCTREQQFVLYHIRQEQLAATKRQAIAQEHAAAAANARNVQANLNYWLGGGPTVGTTRGW